MNPEIVAGESKSWPTKRRKKKPPRFARPKPIAAYHIALSCIYIYINWRK